MATSLRIARDTLLPVLTRRDETVLGSYLDLQTGEVRTLYDPVLAGVDNAALEALLEQHPGRLARVPHYDREYRLMCAFAADVADDELAHALDVALTGQQAFRAFQRVLGDAGVLDGWSVYREQALLRFAEDWLATLGVEVEWDPPTGIPVERAAGPSPGLVAVLALGRPVHSDDGEIVVRVLTASSVGEARALLERAARDLCELDGQPWRRGHLRDGPTFERGAVRLELDGAAVRATVRLTPAWRAVLQLDRLA